jgi:hypothetical protein
MAAPKILIGIPCDMLGAFRGFDASLHKMLELRMDKLGVRDCEVFHAISGVVPAARNRIVRKALQVGAEYVWFLDDDQPFYPGTETKPSDLDRLLAHGLDAVLPLSPRRGPPFLPLLYNYIDESGWTTQRYLDDHEHGLVKIAGAGMAGLLIKTECFKKMGGDGWFEFFHPDDNPDDYSEDFPFYRKLAKAGYQLYCDLDIPFGHATTTTAYIIKQEGKWFTLFADSEPFNMIPQLKHPMGFEKPTDVEAFKRDLDQRRAGGRRR